MVKKGPKTKVMAQVQHLTVVQESEHSKGKVTGSALYLYNKKKRLDNKTFKNVASAIEAAKNLVA